MRTITFPIAFIFDTDIPYQTCFQMELTDEEEQALKKFIHENPGIPFWGMDNDLFDLSERMIDVQTAAIVSCINEAKASNNETPITEESIDWEHIKVGFEWPKDLIE